MPLTPKQQCFDNTLSAQANDVKWAAWQRAFDVHVRRAETQDGHEKEYASRLASRVWPLYVEGCGG